MGASALETRAGSGKAYLIHSHPTVRDEEQLEIVLACSLDRKVELDVEPLRDRHLLDRQKPAKRWGKVSAANN
jgi:hypothetical protein